MVKRISCLLGIALLLGLALLSIGQNNVARALGIGLWETESGDYTFTVAGNRFKVPGEVVDYGTEYLDYAENIFTLPLKTVLPEEVVFVTVDAIEKVNMQFDKVIKNQ